MHCKIPYEVTSIVVSMYGLNGYIYLAMTECMFHLSKIIRLWAGEKVQ